MNHEILFSFDNKICYNHDNPNIFELICYQNASYTCTLYYIITKSRTYPSSFHDNKPTVFNTSGFVGSHSFPAHSVYTAWWAMVSSSSPFSKLPLPFCNFFLFIFQSIFQMSEKENFCILTRENTRLIWLFTSFFWWFAHIGGGFGVRRTPTKENLYRDLCYTDEFSLKN